MSGVAFTARFGTGSRARKTGGRQSRHPRPPSTAARSSHLAGSATIPATEGTCHAGGTTAYGLIPSEQGVPALDVVRIEYSMESNPGSSVHSPGRFGAGRSGRFAERIQRPCKPGRPAIRRPPPCEHPGPRVGAVVEGFIVDENDPPWDTDPLWYDRAESGPAPGPVLE